MVVIQLDLFGNHVVYEKKSRKARKTKGPAMPEGKGK
jgi:hypothetical protein